MANISLLLPTPSAEKGIPKVEDLKKTIMARILFATKQSIVISTANKVRRKNFRNILPVITIKEDVGTVVIFTVVVLPTELVLGSDQKKLTPEKHLVIGKEMSSKVKPIPEESKRYWRGKPDFIKPNFSPKLIQNLE